MFNTTDQTDVKAVTESLAVPFDLAEIRWKPQSVKGNRALALAYIDARLIQDRLDAVLGVEGWQDEYQILPDGSVMCKLQLKLGDRWITKMDVGSPSEQPDGGDRLKAAFSDALKRAAVKFGVGRYLYRIQAQWTDYDPVRKQFTHMPTLPAFALPRNGKAAKPTPANGPSGKPPRREPVGAEKNATHNLPADGDELHRRLHEYDTKLASQRLCGVGALLSHVAQAGAKAGYGEDIARWIGPAIPFAVETVKEFETKVRSPKAATKQAA